MLDLEDLVNTNNEIPTNHNSSYVNKYEFTRSKQSETIHLVNSTDHKENKDILFNLKFTLDNNNKGPSPLNTETIQLNRRTSSIERKSQIVDQHPFPTYKPDYTMTFFTAKKDETKTTVQTIPKLIDVHKFNNRILEFGFQV